MYVYLCIYHCYLRNMLVICALVLESLKYMGDIEYQMLKYTPIFMVSTVCPVDLACQNARMTLKIFGTHFPPHQQESLVLQAWSKLASAKKNSMLGNLQITLAPCFAF